MKRFNQLFKKCTNYMQNGSENGSGSSRFASLSILSRQSVLTIFCLLFLGVGNVWGWEPFYLIGQYTNSNWSSNTKDYNLSGTIANGKYFISVYSPASEKYFAFVKGDNTRYRPSENHYSLSTHSEGQQGTYSAGTADNSWAYTASYKGVIRISIDQTVENNNQYYPWVWVARATDLRLKHEWTAANSWTYSSTMTDNNDGTYSITTNYPTYSSTSGYNLSDYSSSGSYDVCYMDGENITINGEPEGGESCLFVVNSETKKLTITKLCTINYNGNSKTSGDVPSSYANQLYGTEITLSNNTLTKDGYTHTGWNTAADGSGTHYNKNVSYTMTEASLTLYAEWTANVSLDKGTGSVDGSATTYYTNGNFNISLAPTHATAGYTIRGYYAEPGCTTLVVAADGTLQKNVSGFTDASGKWTATETKTLYTKWDNHFTVKFNEHGATGHGTESVEAEYGQNMTTIAVPSKVGYIFGGYFASADGVGTKYYDENGVSAHTWNIGEDTELHAKWTAIHYAIVFDANGGSGTMSNKDMTYDVAADLTANTYTRSGYYFLGWNTHPSGMGTSYYDEKNVNNLASSQGASVTLYAQWAQTYTVYFVLAGIGWNPPYAKAQISYDSQSYYPLDANMGNWISMDEIAEGITLSNASHGSGADKNEYKLYKIDNVPEGASIDFSNNGSSAVGYMSWEIDKPYFVYGNTSWYGLDATSPKRIIDQVTEMSVHLCERNSSKELVASFDYGLNVHGSEKYAIAELKANTTYSYKYVNWIPDPDVYSGYQSENVYIMNENTETGFSGEPGAMNASPGNDVFFYTTVAGEYKFMLTWTGDGLTTPATQMYYPVGVSLGALSQTEAVRGASTTITLTATPAKTYLMTSPTYYYQMSTDNGTSWTTIAETSSQTYDYTFAAQTCKFRVILKNDAGLRSASDARDFTTYTTKSFYVYNPYNVEGQWQYLHLYTWDSNDGNRTYNGSFPSGSAEYDCGYVQGVADATPQNCRNGNTLRYIGNNWFYITIDERANCFMLVGNGGCGGGGTKEYTCHQTLTCYVANYIHDAKYMIYTKNNANYVQEYQAKGPSDFRLKYSYEEDATTKYRYSPIYNTTLDGTTITTSMWLDASDNSANLIIQQGNGEDSWSDVVSSNYSNTSSNGFGGLIDSDAEYGYVYTMKLNINTSTPASSSVSNATLYNGKYYIRTDGVDGGWNLYKSESNTMHYSEVSMSSTPAFDYYLCKWISTANTNVKFTIANDYNPELVASLEGDEVLNGDQKIPQAANVRFAWNSQTNTLNRAYLSGSSVVSDRFLVLVGDGKMFDKDGHALTDSYQIEGLGENEMKFTDDKNWVYEAVVKAQPGANCKLTAKYNNNTQYFWGDSEGAKAWVTLLGGTSTETKYTIRVVYDFKTNRLIKAFIPDVMITSDLAIETDLMIIREEQGSAQQIQFSGSGALSDVETVYGAMKFTKAGLNDDTKSRYFRDLFWVSFPFDVNLNEVFGFGTYGTHWIIERYDGKTRAKNGFWADSPSNWKFITPYQRDSGWVLNAYEGYIVALDLDELTTTSEVWDNGTNEVYLYFPSTGDIGNIEATTKTVPINQEGYVCTIDRRTDKETPNTNKDRTIMDSYWHCIGVPGYANNNNSYVDAASAAVSTKINWTSTNLPYLYEWDSRNNTLSITSTAAFTFQPLYSYLVQYSANQIYWTSINATPDAVAARVQESPDKEYCLKLMRDSIEEDHTYVRLTDDANVTNGFEFNYDLCKEQNGGKANIWTVTTDVIPVAGNSMPKPLQTTLVPVGVKVVANGEYTLAMPEGTNGEDVYLIDNAYGTRTNLGLMPYTVTLTAGTYDSRFALEFAPIQDSPTSLENDGLSRSDELNDANDDVRKVFVGGRLYIIRDGKVYDAAGQRIE